MICAPVWAEVVLVVSGAAVKKDGDDWVGLRGRHVGLYVFDRRVGPRLASDLTGDAGMFSLRRNWDIEGETVFVADEDGDANPVLVHIQRSGDSLREAQKVRLEVLLCDPLHGTADVKSCITANGQTHRLKVRAHVESPQQANEQFSKRTHSLLMNVPKWNQTDVETALAELRKPVGKFVLPSLGGVDDGLMLADARGILASREGNCLPGIKPASSAVAYVALGDRCEGDTEVPTAGGPSLVSVTEGAPRIDDRADQIALSWDPPRSEVCLIAQSFSVETQLPRWRMTRRSRPGEREFIWSAGRARELGVSLSRLGFLAEPCEERGKDDPRIVPVRIGAGASAAPPIVAVVRTTSMVRDATVTVVDVRDDGTTETTHPKVAPYSSRDSHPTIWFEIPRAAKGPGTAKVSVMLRGLSAFGDSAPLSFSFRHP